MYNKNITLISYRNKRDEKIRIRQRLNNGSKRICQQSKPDDTLKPKFGIKEPLSQILQCYERYRLKKIIYKGRQMMTTATEAHRFYSDLILRLILLIDASTSLK